MIDNRAERYLWSRCKLAVTFRLSLFIVIALLLIRTAVLRSISLDDLDGFGKSMCKDRSNRETLTGKKAVKSRNRGGNLALVTHDAVAIGVLDEKGGVASFTEFSEATG